MELKSVSAVVTGGASGLGRATAAHLVAAGGRVAILDRADVAGGRGGARPGRLPPSSRRPT